MPPAPETCWRSIPRQSPGRGKTPPTRMSRSSLTAPHCRAHRRASAPAARPATLSMCASSIPGRCVAHEPGRRLSAIAPGRASRATACYPLLFASSGSPSADAPFGSLNHASESPCPASSRHRPANGFPLAGRRQPQRRPGKSIAANVAPRVQSNRVSAAASRRRNSYFVGLRTHRRCDTTSGMVHTNTAPMIQ